MTQERKPYNPTEQAGPWIAGKRTPTKSTQVEKDGKTMPAVVVDTEAVIELTEEEARYELTSGTIAPVVEAKPAKR